MDIRPEDKETRQVDFKKANIFLSLLLPALPHIFLNKILDVLFLYYFFDPTYAYIL